MAPTKSQDGSKIAPRGAQEAALLTRRGRCTETDDVSGHARNAHIVKQEQRVLPLDTLLTRRNSRVEADHLSCRVSPPHIVKQ